MEGKEYTSPQYVYDEIYKRLPDVSLEFIHKLILDHDKELKPQLSNYIDTILADYFMDKSKQVFDLNTTYQKFYRRILTTKSNWYKQLKKEAEKGHSSIHNEWYTLHRYLNNSDNETELDSLELHIKKQMQMIDEWANDSDKLLSEFPYIRQTKKGFQIKKAAENDLVLTIAKVFKSMPRNLISQRANILVNNPVFSDDMSPYAKESHSDSVQQLSLDDIAPIDRPSTTNLNNQNMVMDDYSYEEKQNKKLIRSILELDDNDSIYFRKYYTLDSTDSQILDYILNQRDEELFYKEGTVIVDIAALSKKIYKHLGEKQYRLVENRLHKIAASSVQGYSSGEEKRISFTINFFDSVKVTTEHERITAQIRFSKTIHDQLINNQTIGIYSHYLDKLENKVAKLLVYNLQKERLDAYLEGRPTKEYFDYNFFISRIRFSVRTVDSTLKRVQSALEEFLKHDILLNSYERYGAGFYINLKPLSDAEKGDYFSKSDSTTFMLT